MEPFLPFKNSLHFQATRSLPAGSRPFPSSLLEGFFRVFTFPEQLWIAAAPPRPDVVQGWAEPRWQLHPWCQQGWQRGGSWPAGRTPKATPRSHQKPTPGATKSHPQEPPKAVALASLQPGESPEPSAVLVYLQPEPRLEFTLSANPAGPRN